MSLAYAPDRPLRIAVLISGGGTTLENIYLRIKDGRLRNITIPLVISSRDAVRGADIARKAELPLVIIQKRDIPESYDFSRAIVRALDKTPIDLVVMGGFLHLWRIPPHYAGRVLNIHPALLPNFGGRGMFGVRVHEAVLAAGAAESGATVHLADNQYDHGPPVARVRVPVAPDDTPDTLASRVGRAERELYPRVLQSVADEGLEWLARQAVSPLQL